MGHGESEGICKEAVVDYPNSLAEVTDEYQEQFQDRIREHLWSTTAVPTRSLLPYNIKIK
jgi:hypothetical protein